MIALARITLLAGCLVCTLLPANSLTAQTKAKEAGKNRSTTRSAPKSLPGVTPEREAAALMFVKRHHPQLAELLIHLEEQDKRQYQRAVRDLFRTSERLAQLQEREAERYELELRVWKIRSRIQLYSAQLAMHDDPEVRQRLKTAFREQGEVQRDLLQRERTRVAERLKRIDEQLEELKSRQKEDLEKKIDARVERKAKGARIRRDPKAPTERMFP
jgi:hypothetical protein